MRCHVIMCLNVCLYCVVIRSTPAIVISMAEIKLNSFYRQTGAARTDHGQCDDNDADDVIKSTIVNFNSHKLKISRFIFKVKCTNNIGKKNDNL